MIPNYKDFFLDFYETFTDYPSDDNAVVVTYRGCEHGCKGCHSSQLQKPNANPIPSDKVFMNRFMDDLYGYCCRCNNTRYVVLLGGDPLHPYNRDFTYELSWRGQFFYCLYTGYEIEDIVKWNINVDFVKCGKFDVTQFQPSGKTNSFLTFASKNQKLYKNIPCKHGLKYELVSKNGCFSLNRE